MSEVFVNAYQEAMTTVMQDRAVRVDFYHPETFAECLSFTEGPIVDYSKAGLFVGAVEMNGHF